MALQDDVAELNMVVQRIVIESVDPKGFDARSWLDNWLAETVPALGDRRPLDVLKEPGGLDVVRDLLLRVQSGAYS